MSGTAATAQPSGGTVVSGQAGISSTGNTTLINQSTQKAIIDWQDFSVAAGGAVQFAQPDAQSITLNRVIGAGVSTIEGALTANGQVWILNPNGVLFGHGARVNVAGLLATTADIADGDFVAGDYRFSEGTAAGVINDGVIHAADGGSVVLSSARVSNSGLIQADAGSVVLGGATAFTLDFTGDNLLRYAVAPSDVTGPNRVSNSGRIAAAGGKVLLTARAAQNVVDGVINNSGIIEAVSAREVNGRIILDAGEGTVQAGGAIDASGRGVGESGGSVEILGKAVEVADGTLIDASGDAGGGEIVIGGNFHGAGPQANAATTRVGKATISADAITAGDGGDVSVWSDDNTWFGGSISARGGATGGNGGEVETSGAVLSVAPGASVVTSAPAGNAGHWLLDPIDLSIVDSGGEDTILAGGLIGFDDPGTTVLTGTIETALQNGNVTLQAHNDITVEGGIDGDGKNTLKLDAGRSILFVDNGYIINETPENEEATSGRVILHANHPDADPDKRGAGPGTISMAGFNYIIADEIDLIVGENAAGGGIGSSESTVTVNGDLHVETAGYDAYLDSFGLNLGNSAHATAVDLGGGNLSLTVTGLTQTAPIAVNDLTIGVVGDVPNTEPISLTDADNAITGTVNALSIGGTYGGGNQIEITNSQALTLGDITVYADPFGEGNFPDYGGIEIVTTSGGILIGGAIEGGSITLQAAGDIVQNASGLITAHGSSDGSVGGTLSVTSTDGTVSLPNANALVPNVVCAYSECDPPQEQLNPGQLTVTAGSDAVLNFITPVDVHGANTGGDFSLTVFGDYLLTDEYGEPQLVDNQIGIVAPIVAGEFITLHATGDIVQYTDYYEDRHLEGIGLIATSDNGSLYLDNAGNGSSDPGNRVGGDINGYVILNSAGDAYFTNTVHTVLGGHAYYPLDGKGEQVEMLYPFAGTPMLPPDGYDSPTSTIGGNLNVQVIGLDAEDNPNVLVVAGRVHALNGYGGYSVLKASGDIANNNGYGTIIVGNFEGENADVSLVSDLGSVGGDDGTHWSFGLGAGDGGLLNLHAEAKNGEIVINPGDLNIGLDFLDDGEEPLFAPGIQTNYFLVFGNGTVTQNADSTGVIHAGALDIHSRGDIVLDNDHNVVTGSVDFYAYKKFDSELLEYVESDITFHNSVDTYLTRATGVSPDGDPDAPPLPAGNVTIIVEDTSGETTPTLTLGNRAFTNGKGEWIPSSIGSAGDVYLQADGSITDGYDPDDLDSGKTAGFVKAGGSLSVVAEEGDISLGNPVNAVKGDVDLTAGPTYDIEDPIPSDITFANSVNTTLVRANGGEKFGTYIEYAGNVTILVADPAGDTNPWLTIGNTSFVDEGDNKVNSSINTVGNVILLAGGIVSDGFDPNNGDTWDGAGFVEGETLTVTSAADEIWLQNPYNGFNGLTATTDNKDVTITAFAWSSYLNVNGIDAGTGNVTLTVNDSDLIQSGAITAGDLTVSTHDVWFEECTEGCGFPILYGVYLSESNSIGGTISVDALGGVFIRNSVDTTLGTSSAGLSFTVISDGDLTIDEDATIHGGSAGEDDASVLLVAHKAFHNEAGSDAISLQSEQRWLIYSDNPDDNTFGGLDSGNTAIWNTTYDGENFIGEAGNRYVFAYQPVIVVTSTDVEKTYGDDATAEVAEAYEITGLHEGVEGAFLGDSAGNVYSGTPTVTSEGSKADADVGGSPYAITVANGSLEVFGGYGVSLVSDGVLIVDPLATLYYVADAASRKYGEENDIFTGHVDGFLDGDTQENSTEGTLVFTSDATAGSSVGSYAINGSGLTSQNYAFAQDADNATALTITKATLTYEADKKNRTYGAANPPLTGDVTGFVNGDTLALDTTGTLVFTTDATKASGVGEYAVTGSGLAAENYDFVQAEGNLTALTIDPATLTYVADAKTRTYGADNPAFTGTVTGFVNDETLETATDGTLAFGSAATKTSNVGSYAIDGSGLTADNYVFVQAAGNATALTVDPATLTYVADAKTRIYGADNPSFTGTVTGFVNDETLESATDGTMAFGSTATKTSNVGQYAVNGSGLTALNYVFVQAAGNGTALTIDPATLTYVADAASRTYGEDNPTFTGTVTGFVNGDTLEADTTGTLAFLSPATAASGVGSYAIDGSGLSAQNYVFVQAENNATALTIDPAILTYNAMLMSRIYGEENPEFSGTVTGFVNGENQETATSGTLVFTSTATAASNVGSYAIDGSGLSADNYIFVQAETNATALTIDPATLTYIADAVSRTYGEDNPAFTGTVTGFVNGDTQESATTGTLACASPADASSNVGCYAIDGSGVSAQN
ncbi:MAG: MBG domain-containing protein, partial [Sphingomonadales bacterium]